MSDHHLKKISDTLNALEKELIKSGKKKNTDEKPNLDYKQNEAILEEHSVIREKLNHQKSIRKLWGWLINAIRSKLYKEVDMRYDAAITSQEVFNKHCLKEIRALRKEIQLLKKN